MYPFDSHYLDINGFKCHYVDEGRGEPVVMVHGNPTWSFYYRALIESLRGNFRTIAPDHIGCGLSDKPRASQYNYTLQTRIDDLEYLIEHLTGPEKINLVVHDWGGMIGVAYALRHPQKINRLILFNTAAFPPPDTKNLPWRLRLVRNTGPLAAALVLGFNVFAVGALYMASRRGLARDVKGGLIAPYNCWMNRIATLKFVQDIPLTEQDPSYRIVKEAGEQLQRIADLPMLICWGEHDFVFDADYLAEWRRRFPDAEVHRFQEAGHYVLEDVPEKIIDITRSFLERHPLQKDKPSNEFHQ